MHIWRLGELVLWGHWIVIVFVLVLVPVMSWLWWNGVGLILKSPFVIGAYRECYSCFLRMIRRPLVEGVCSGLSRWQVDRLRALGWE